MGGRQAAPRHWPCTEGADSMAPRGDEPERRAVSLTRPRRMSPARDQDDYPTADATVFELGSARRLPDVRVYDRAMSLGRQRTDDPEHQRHEPRRGALRPQGWRNFRDEQGQRHPAFRTKQQAGQRQEPTQVVADGEPAVPVDRPGARARRRDQAGQPGDQGGGKKTPQRRDRAGFLLPRAGLRRRHRPPAAGLGLPTRSRTKMATGRTPRRTRSSSDGETAFPR